MTPTDLSASLSNSQAQAANPVAQFGNVYGGGRNKDWWLYLLVGGIVVGGLIWAWKKLR